MSVTVQKNTPIQTTLAVTLTRIIAGDDVRLIHVSAPSEIYLVYDNALVDGDAVPATARFRIPANVVYPILITGVRPFICATSGAVITTLIGYYD